MNKYYNFWIQTNNIKTYVFTDEYKYLVIDLIENIESRDKHIVWGKEGRCKGPFIISRKSSEHGLEIVMDIISQIRNIYRSSNIIIQFMRRVYTKKVLYNISLLSSYNYNYYHRKCPLEVLHIIEGFIQV